MSEYETGQATGGCGARLWIRENNVCDWVWTGEDKDDWPNLREYRMVGWCCDPKRPIVCPTCAQALRDENEGYADTNRVMLEHIDKQQAENKALVDKCAALEKRYLVMDRRWSEATRQMKHVHSDQGLWTVGDILAWLGRMEIDHPLPDEGADGGNEQAIREADGGG